MQIYADGEYKSLSRGGYNFLKGRRGTIAFGPVNGLLREGLPGGCL